MNMMMKDAVMAQERYADMRREAEQRARFARMLADAKPAAQPKSKRSWFFWRWVRRSTEPVGATA